MSIEQRDRFGLPDRPCVQLNRRQQTLRLRGDNPPLTWYPCALPHSWCWDDNAHLAFEHAPNHTWSGDALVPGLHVELENARPIEG
ncbi:hypothetical protein [Streptomyces sp. NPDC056661]|uniref:hypothetical protein n=1 Tax=unclassified Streptomyces TaxID=2593676 RepID=UPI0036925891